MQARSVASGRAHARSTLRETLTAPTVSAQAQWASRLQRVALGLTNLAEIKSRVPSFTLITLSTVYPNSTGVCGWEQVHCDEILARAIRGEKVCCRPPTETARISLAIPNSRTI